MKTSSFHGHHLPKTHGLNSEKYDKLVDSRTELRQFQMVTGFTAKRGQCGFCMKVFQSTKHLLGHRRKTHNLSNNPKLGHKGVSKVSL